MAFVNRCAVGFVATALAAGLAVAGTGTVSAKPTGYPHAPRDYGSTQSAPLLPTLEGGAYAVDGSDLYVADVDFHRVIKIVAGEEEPITLPFLGLYSPHGIAEENGDVYVADTGNNRVLVLADGQSTPVTLPFTGLSGPRSIAVENGNVYVADTGNGRILMLREGDSTPTVLPFGQLNSPTYLAIENGNVYVAEYNTDHVIELPAGASTPTTLPFTSTNRIYGLAVDNGDVYFFDMEASWIYLPFGSFTQKPPAEAVRKVAAGSTTPATLRFDRLREPAVLHIDNGVAYLVDGVHERVSTPLTTSPSTGSGNSSLGNLFGS